MPKKPNAKSKSATAPSSTASALGRLRLQVADDDMTAWIQLKPGTTADGLTAEHVIEVATKQGIAINELVQRRAGEFIQRLENGPPPEAFVLSKGVEPVKEVHERFEWDDEFQMKAKAWQEDGPTDFYSFNSILTVRSGQYIGTIVTPPKTPGVDVYGRKLSTGVTVVPLEVEAKSLKRANGSPAKITTEAAGLLVEEDGTLRIDEVLVIDDSVSFETGNIDSRVSVSIEGLVPDRFKVRAKGSISVGQSVESARLAATRDVVVRQGIIGRSCGVVKAGTSIATKYTTDAHLVAGGDVRVLRQMMNTHVCCGGRLRADKASIIGGTIYARDGAEIMNLGSNAGVKTKLVVGVDALPLREVAVMNRNVKTGKVKVGEIRAERKKILEDVHLTNKARIVLSGTIFPKSIIRIADREIRVEKPLRGPCIIERRKIDNVTQIVAVNRLTGSITSLKHHRQAADDLLDDFELEQDYTT